MFVAGLTGGIGSGKSTVSALLAERGAVVIDADLIARRVVERGSPTLALLVKRFGSEILTDDGSLDRARLASIAFADPALVADLNAITHPAVGAVIAGRLAEMEASDAIVILDVPLLVEGGRYDLRTLIVVDCPEEVALSRLVVGRGMDEGDARRRIAAQASRSDRLARADVVIDNSGRPDALIAQVDRLWAELRALSVVTPEP